MTARKHWTSTATWRGRRGGFCYELTGAFAALLEALGVTVTLLAARAYGSAGLGPPFDHLALRVDTPEPWLVDVGCGRHTDYPLRLDVAAEQHDPGGVFRVVAREHGDVDVLMNEEPQYRLEPHPRELTDFEETCWWHQTSPKSHFTQSLIRSLPTGRASASSSTACRHGGPPDSVPGHRRGGCA
jgi:N-hydroxyarylamine O-acetyltransferase